MVLVNLFPTIERPETTPMRWAESGADEDGQVLDRGREREREVFGAPDCGRSDYRPESWQRDGVVLVILFPTIERPETTPHEIEPGPEWTAAQCLQVGSAEAGAGPAPLFRRAKLRGGGESSIYSVREVGVPDRLCVAGGGEGLCPKSRADAVQAIGGLECMGRMNGI